MGLNGCPPKILALGDSEFSPKMRKSPYGVAVNQRAAHPFRSASSGQDERRSPVDE